MKKTIPIIVGFLVILLISNLSSAARVAVSIQDVNVNEGETITVPIMLNVEPYYYHEMARS